MVNSKSFVETATSAQVYEPDFYCNCGEYGGKMERKDEKWKKDWCISHPKGRGSLSSVQHSTDTTSNI